MELTCRSKASMPSNITANHRSPELFDGQAGYFDRRAGLPEEWCRDVAKKVIEIGGAGPDHLIVEVGSGTGQIGKWFEAPVIYLGFDLSANMLGEFKHCLDGSRDKLLIQADANANWPIVDGAARIIFSSRAAHLLDPERVASEAFRVAAPSGATLILGRVERAPESIKDRLAIEMDECLRRQGFEGRRGHRK
ncbi:MAG: class I SAM-dependent methyltransferase, partial [Blastocatellia bacterium]